MPTKCSPPDDKLTFVQSQDKKISRYSDWVSLLQLPGINTLGGCKRLLLPVQGSGIISQIQD